MNEDFKILFSGCMSGVAQTWIGYPLDTVKIRYIEGKDKNIINCIKHIKNDGYRNFYKGVSAPILGAVFSGAQCFYTYSLFKKYTNNSFIAGNLSGIVLSLTESPTDLIKSRMQINPKATYKETINKILLKKELTKGLGATMLRNSFATGIFFSSYEYVKNIVTEKTNIYVGIGVAGSVAGCLSWGLNYPIDNIKTRIQTDTKNRYKGIFDCYRKTKMKCLWHGFAPCMVRASIVNPCVFMAYELSIKAFN